MVVFLIDRSTVVNNLTLLNIWWLAKFADRVGKFYIIKCIFKYITGIIRYMWC